MQHNATKEKGENLDIFSYATNLNTFEMYKLSNDGVLTDITPNDYVIESIGEDLSRVNVTLPDEDVIVCGILNMQPVFLRVGDPAVRYLLHSSQKPQFGFPYSRMDTLGYIIEAGNLTNYGSGIYGFVPKDNIYSIIKCENVVTPLAVPYDANKACSNNGTILLQRGVWQMIAIPVVDNVFDGFINKLEIQTGIPATDLIEAVSCYRGDLNKFLSFVPGVTRETSIHNFPLTHLDGDSLEIVAMWVKCKKWTHTDEGVLFEWKIK